MHRVHIILLSLGFEFPHNRSSIIFVSFHEVLPFDYVIALFGVYCTFSRRITIHLSLVWVRRAAPGFFPFHAHFLPFLFSFFFFSFSKSPWSPIFIMVGYVTFYMCSGICKAQCCLWWNIHVE